MSDEISHSCEDSTLSKNGEYIQQPVPSNDSSSNDNNSYKGNQCVKSLDVLKKSRVREILFILIICSSQFSTLLGAVQGMPQIAAIGVSFNVPADRFLILGWANGAFATTVGSFVILAGKLGDVLGHKLIFCIGYGWLALWSLITGFSRYSESSPIFYFFCRGFQGIGAGLLTPTSIALLGKTYPDSKKKNYIFAFFGACAPWGIVCGITFSSLFTQLSHWSWAYWSMGIVCTLITAMAIIVIPSDTVAECNKGLTYRDFDYLGAFCGISGLILFSVVWGQVPPDTFHAPYTYILLIISVLLLIANLYIDSKVKDPLLPWRSMSPENIGVLLCVFLAYTSFTVWLFYSFQYATIGRGDTLLNASARIAPMAVTAIVASVCNAIVMHYGILPQLELLIALVCICVATILVGTITSHQTFWSENFVSILFISFALDIIFPTATLLFSNGVPDELKGISAGAVATILNYATALGPPMATTVIRYRCNECLTRVGPSYTQTVHIALYLAMGFSGVGVLVAAFGVFYQLCIKNRRKTIESKKLEIESL